MREKALADVDVEKQRGLEIGPLARPVVSKERGSVFYVDHASRHELQAKYALDVNMAPMIQDIVDVDYVVADGMSLVDVAGPDGPFDYVIACHLIEHVPDLIRWFQETAELLVPGGVLSLIIPDKRYTFDINRSVTEVGALVDAYLDRRTRPSRAQIYDFFAKAINGVVDPSAVWAGTADYSEVVRDDYPDPDVAAFEHCQLVFDSDDFIDVHCHVFTPGSFFDLLEAVARLGLLPFEVGSVFPTAVDDIEFFVSLHRLPEGEPIETTASRQAESLRRARRAVRSTVPMDSSRLEVSVLERRLILAKRHLLSALRSRFALGRLQHP